ncbi:MAG: ASCH domain-containing protein [Anaerolineae bacterium]|nr:ASCH domain-containing protein [Anaerolineae bacterium]
MTDSHVQAFWQRYLDTLPPGHPHHQAAYSAWSFGDSPALADELGQLVVEGAKTATASAVWEYEHDGTPPPHVGELSVILAGDGTPLGILETTEVRTLTFNAVDSDFAAEEGEGDRSLAYWREAHRRYFSRVLPPIGRTFDETMPVLCERFRVVFQV